jgi:hypothetical protein
LQCLKDLSPADTTPLGYASKANLQEAEMRYPNPLNYFSDWILKEDT